MYEGITTGDYPTLFLKPTFEVVRQCRRTATVVARFGFCKFLKPLYRYYKQVSMVNCKNQNPGKYNK